MCSAQLYVSEYIARESHSNEIIGLLFGGLKFHPLHNLFYSPEPVHHLPSGMCCQLSQHTNTCWLVKLQSLVSCPSAGGGKKLLMSLLFLHNSLFACLAGMHKFLFPIHSGSHTRAENPPAVPNIFQSAPMGFSQDPASLGMGATSSFGVSMLMWGFFSLLNIISCLIERET